MFLTFMPAVRAACGFSPTARNRKPSVDRLISHQTTAVMTMTSTKPQLRLYRAPNRSGRIAVSSVAGDLGFALPGACSRPCVRNMKANR